jgi:predicted Holliday junction resolvase-like endonuclease
MILDIFLFTCITLFIFICIYKQYFYKPATQKSTSQTEIDKLLDREKDKDIIHNKEVDDLRKEITLLKNSSTELNIKNQNLYIDYSKLKKEASEEKFNLNNKLLELTEEKRKVTSQKKSSEVRLGHIAETLAPFLDQFDFDPETCVFLGKPIDYISFGDDEITFIEIKSGKSQLNTKQRYIRDQIKSKLVSWKEVRIK